MTLSAGMTDLSTPGLPDPDRIRTLHELLAGYVPPTPLVRLNERTPDRNIFLKLETHTPIGAFKIRPALGALLLRDRETLRNGVATVSSGNLAFGMAWAAHALDIPMVAYMVKDAPRAKIDGVRRMGGEVRFVSAETWWGFITGTARPDIAETFVNPVTDPGVLAGNGTIGLEIAGQLPTVSSVWAPFGGGSLITGIAGAFADARSRVEFHAVESDHAAPATAAIAEGQICEIPTRPSFIKSMGGPSVVPSLWPLTERLLSGTCVVSEKAIVAAIRLLFSANKTVAEGAGAASLAAALSDPRATGDVVCIISGGNIDAVDYIRILRGEVPDP